VNAPASTFERNGKQYVVAYAGGTSLAPSTSVVRPRGRPANRTADIAHGLELYSQTCVACRGAVGRGRIHGAALATTKLNLEEIVMTPSNGPDQMPAFGRAYKPEDLQDVAAYILERLATHRSIVSARAARR
jgi:mono/diheme cytochrome c family protein